MDNSSALRMAPSLLYLEPMSKRLRKFFCLPRRRLGPLLFLVALQVIISLGFSQYRPSVYQGYLVKNGANYLILWKQDGKYWQREFAELDEALKFSQDGLALDVSASVDRASNLERVWMDEKIGSYTLLWKRMNFPYLHQWTFNSQREADYFLAKFRLGAYSPSPYGHAVVLRPRDF